MKKGKILHMFPGSNTPQGFKGFLAENLQGMERVFRRHPPLGRQPRAQQRGGLSARAAAGFGAAAPGQGNLH